MIDLLVQVFYVFAGAGGDFILCLHSARLGDCARGCTFIGVIRSSPKETIDTSDQEQRIRMADL